uniref:inositol-polyphosphate 5-phosphatase n=1 Tax=Camelus bactrianus TaxID=9837 RepID=A0A9W3G2J7_CAMBA|nr:inositol polyphosphate-5-phosphatase A isoform X2 [Camelus bactrianus]
MGLFAGCNSFLGHSDTPLQKEPNKAWLFLFLTLTRASRGGRGCSAGFLGTRGLPALPPATLGGAAFRAAGWVAHAHRPHFLALHCQEFGGKNYEASMSHVDKFVKELLSSDAMKEYNRARVYLDENYKSQEHFTALGSFYFLHESLKNIYQFDFKAKKYKKVTGKEIYSDTLESTPMLEKEKFPQDYFPECKWSRKGFIRTRWCVADCAFDLVNIHLFHDASNLVAWETSPSVYSGIRRKALGYVLNRISDQRFEKASYFVFGDFNFRLDSKSVVETLCTKATMQTVRAADTNEVVKLIFRESDNDRKVTLQLEKKLFDYVNQEVFRDNNGTALLEFDKELSVFKDRLCELDISFPPRGVCHCSPRSDGTWLLTDCDLVLCSTLLDAVLMFQTSAAPSVLVLRGCLRSRVARSPQTATRVTGWAGSEAECAARPGQWPRGCPTTETLRAPPLHPG